MSLKKLIIKKQEEKIRTTKKKEHEWIAHSFWWTLLGRLRVEHVQPYSAGVQIWSLGWCER